MMMLIKKSNKRMHVKHDRFLPSLPLRSVAVKFTWFGR